MSMYCRRGGLLPLRKKTHPTFGLSGLAADPQFIFFYNSNPAYVGDKRHVSICVEYPGAGHGDIEVSFVQKAQQRHSQASKHC